MPTCWSSWPSTSTRTCSARARCSRRARTTPAPTPTSPSTATSSPTRRVVAELKKLYRHPADRAAPARPRPALRGADRERRRRRGTRSPTRSTRTVSCSRSRMPRAEVGFAIASHHLWMAEGTRHIDVVRLASPPAPLATAARQSSSTGPTCGAGSPPTKGWIEKQVDVARRDRGRSASRSTSTATTRRSPPTTRRSTATGSRPACRCCW